MRGYLKGDPRAREAGAKGGQRAADTRWRRALRKIQGEWPGMPLAAANAIHAFGVVRYRSGWNAKRRAA